MKFEQLKTVEQFKALKKGDAILVKWWDNWVTHHPRTKKIMFYNIYENKARCDEIICRLQGNHYFNYMSYLKGISAAEEVYKVTIE